MSNYYKTNGVILASRDVGEYDCIVTCLTQDFGRVELLAKAVRKITSKLRGGLQPFLLSWLEFVEGRHGYIVTEAMERENFFVKDRYDIEKADILFSLRDFLLHFMRGREKDEKLWNFLIPILRRFAQKSNELGRPEFLAEYAKWNIAALAGYAPEVHCCVQCRRVIGDDRVFFSTGGGGILCARCAEIGEQNFEYISTEAIELLHSILGRDLSAVRSVGGGASCVTELKKLSDNYFSSL